MTAREAETTRKARSRRSWSLLPEPGDQRTLALATLLGTIGKGIFLTAGVLYFVRVPQLASLEVGVGLSAAGLISLVLGILGGHLADTYGARGIFVLSLLLGAASTASFVLVGNFWVFLVTATIAVTAQAASLVARGPIINHIAPDNPQELRAYVRSVTNVGISLGAVIAGVAAYLDTVGGYTVLVLANAAFLLSAGLVALALPRVRPLPVADGPKTFALKDPPYLVLSVLDGILSIQYRVLTIALPLWIVGFTASPNWMVSVAVVLNTVIIILFQVRATRNVVSPRAGGRVLRRSGFAFLIACAAFAWAASLPTWTATALILAAVVVHSLGELWQAAGGFELSNSLAPPQALGQYLGVFGIGMGIAESFGPVLLIALCITWGTPGWFAVGALFAVAALMVPPVVRWAERTRPEPPRLAV